LLYNNSKNHKENFNGDEDEDYEYYEYGGNFVKFHSNDNQQLNSCQNIQVPDPSNSSQSIDWYYDYNSMTCDFLNGYTFMNYSINDKDGKFGYSVDEACCFAGGGVNYIFDIKERIDEDKILCDIEVYNYDSGISEKYKTNDKIKYILDGTFSYTPNLICISFKNENIQALHSKTFSNTPRLEQVDLSGNNIKLIGSDIFIDNIGLSKKNQIEEEANHRFVIDLPNVTNISDKIMIVLYPETIIRLASENLIQKYNIGYQLSDINYENLDSENIETQINYFINSYINDLSPSDFKKMILVLLGANDKLINNKIKIGKLNNRDKKLCDCDNSVQLKCTEIITDSENGFEEYDEIAFKNSFRVVYYKDIFFETDIAYWRCKFTDCDKTNKNLDPVQTSQSTQRLNTTQSTDPMSTTSSNVENTYLENNESITKYSLYSYNYKDNCFRHMSFIELFEQLQYLKRLLEYTQQPNTYTELPREIKFLLNEGLLKKDITNTREALTTFVNSNLYIDKNILRIFSREDTDICNSESCKKILPSYNETGLKSKSEEFDMNYECIFSKVIPSLCRIGEFMNYCSKSCKNEKMEIQNVNPPYKKNINKCEDKNTPINTSSASIENFTDYCKCKPYNIEYIINNKRVSKNILLSEVDLTPDSLFLYYKYTKEKRFKILFNALRVLEPIEPSEYKENLINFANLYFNYPSQLLSAKNKNVEIKHFVKSSPNCDNSLPNWKECMENKCVDSSNGATDSYGDGCDFYDSWPGYCDTGNTETFNARDMCCSCGGGTPCVDSSNGATDSYGYGCDFYDSWPGYCDTGNTETFNARDMCCSCGGGTISADEIDNSLFNKNNGILRKEVLDKLGEVLFKKFVKMYKNGENILSTKGSNFPGYKMLVDNNELFSCKLHYYSGDIFQTVEDSSYYIDLNFDGKNAGKRISIRYYNKRNIDFLNENFNNKIISLKDLNYKICNKTTESENCDNIALLPLEILFKANISYDQSNAESNA
jgi:hypothetical protein